MLKYWSNSDNVIWGSMRTVQKSQVTKHNQIHNTHLFQCLDNSDGCQNVYKRVILARCWKKPLTYLETHDLIIDVVFPVGSDNISKKGEKEIKKKKF